MLIPQEIIRKKRDQQELSVGEISAFVEGIGSKEVAEAQISALAMAVFFRGMTRPETVALTQALKNSGSVLQWDLPGPVYDKHSTGGVGDVVSLMLGPILAAAGGYVPMLSGRGLGHTGGTLDKLDAIPGYNTQPDNLLFQRVVRDVGVAIIGQTGDLAPADKIFYAVRDTTATVESIPLITASILSKKLAAGLDYLAMDVKTGSGAFMANYQKSCDLARSIIEVAAGAGLRTCAVLTDMNQSLAPSAGNALEVRDALRYLVDDHCRTADLARLHTVTKTLCAELLLLCHLASSIVEAETMIEKILTSGRAAQKFAQMVCALGGPADLLEQPEKYFPAAEIIRPVYAPQGRAGFVHSIDVHALGMTVVALGGGRKRASDAIDFRVGLSRLAASGDKIDGDRPLALVHANSETDFAEAQKRIEQAYTLAEAKPDVLPKAVYEVFGKF